MLTVFQAFAVVSAFLVISDAREVLGEGFKSGSSYDNIIITKKRSRQK
jgi:hypothetical protein